MPRLFATQSETKGLKCVDEHLKLVSLSLTPSKVYMILFVAL